MFVNLMTVFIAAEAEHHENGVQLAGDIREVIWGSAAFFILLGLIIWKLGPRFSEMLKARTESIRLEIETAEQERVEAENALELSSKSIPDLGQERSRIRKEAQEVAEKLKEEISAKAIADRDQILEKGRQDCEVMERQASSDLKNHVISLTGETTEAVVINDIDAKRQTDLINSYIEKVGQLS